jgi:ubiquinone/menaquinone biosynthesis C-methylase UbiE
MNKSIKSNLLNKILPDVLYEDGFYIDGKKLPFYSYCNPNIEANWSDEMSDFLEETSRNHFIDIYNRKIAIDGIKEKLINRETNYLDIGCSSGYLLEEISSAFPEVNLIGSDYSGISLIHCHKRLPSIPLFQIDLVDCPFEDNFFDAITCLNVLEHIQKDFDAIKQLQRIIKPDGSLVITVPVGQHLYDMYDETHYHIRRYNLKELMQKVTDTGLKIIKINYFGVFIYPLFFLVKKLNKLRYDKLSFEEKMEKMVKQAKITERSMLMENLCFLEKYIGQNIRYPFGIRGYIYATK